MRAKPKGKRVPKGTELKVPGTNMPVSVYKKYMAALLGRIDANKKFFEGKITPSQLKKAGFSDEEVAYLRKSYKK